jgi:hypothetical protein
MKYCEVKYNDRPEQFYISYNGMHYNPHSKLTKAMNTLKNHFNGYYAILNRKRLRKKLNKKLNKA